MSKSWEVYTSHERHSDLLRMSPWFFPNKYLLNNWEKLLIMKSLVRPNLSPECQRWVSHDLGFLWSSYIPRPTLNSSSDPGALLLLQPAPSGLKAHPPAAWTRHQASPAFLCLPSLHGGPAPRPTVFTACEPLHSLLTGLSVSCTFLLSPSPPSPNLSVPCLNPAAAPHSFHNF